MSEYEHLHPGCISQLDLDIEERVDWTRRPRWIGYPSAQIILRKFDDLLRHPKESRMPNMLLVGSSNNGKTELIKHFCRLHEPDENPNGEHIKAPVLYFQAPPSPTESGFYSEILSSLYERVPSASTDARRARVIHVLKAIELKVLFIDELHNILAGASVKQQQFLNMIKYLSNELEISIVGSGTGDLVRAVSVDPQVQNRFVPTVLPLWKMDKEFKQLLMSFERLIPLKLASNLHTTLTARKIYSMSEGTIGEVSTLLKTAAIYAMRHEIELINDEVLNNCGYIPPSDRTPAASRVK